MIVHYRFRLLCAFMVIALLPSRATLADVVLKPNGQRGFPLRTRALKANAVIDGPFAATRLIFTFQNETSDRIEADFLYTLPRDTVVTYFAYWFGSEKVVARIVEKEKAAAIYQHITSRMRDPALVEMVGKDTFRARIFPVMPNADLKVEMILMQILPSQGRSIGYSFPLGAAQKQTYDSLDFRVAWRRDAGIERYASNYDTNLTLEKDFARFRLQGTNFRPPKDLRMTAVRTPRPLHTELYAAPSGSSGGFFALALTPDRTLTRPTVQIHGVTTSEVLPARLPDTKPGRTLRLFGRYKGSGPATITLIGTNNGEPVWYSEKVTFGSKTVTNNIASKLWAWRKIEQLSANDANRNAVISLSKRFLLPSKFTSWLAVPKEEMERYKREKIEAEIEVTAQRLAREIGAGRERSATARHLRKQLANLCAQVSVNPQQALQGYMYNVVYRLAHLVAEEILNRRGSGEVARRLRARLNRLCHRFDYDPDDALRNQMYYHVSLVARRLGAEIKKGDGQGEVARRLRAQLDDYCKYTKDDPQETLRYYVSADFRRVSWNLAEEIRQGQENSEAARKLREKLDGLCRQMGFDTNKELHYNLRDELAQLASNLMRAERGSHISRRVRVSEDNHTYEYAATPDDPEGKPSPEQAASLHKQLERMARAVGKTAKDYTRPVELLWAEYDARQIREKLLDERKKPKPDPKIVRELETRFHALNRQVKGERAASAQNRLLVRKTDRQKLYVMLRESKSYLADAKKEYEEFMRSEGGSSYRMGDPLIQVEAPEDAEQVIALLPGGEIKRLIFNVESQKWEARFDIPGYAMEGAYVITIIIVRKDGTRQTLVLRYQVDVTPPAGTGRALAVKTPEPTLRLELDASEDTARVTALLPWNETLFLTRSAQTPNRFFALVPVPEAFQNQPAVVTFILTDSAHNRTTVTVNME